ncbi:MULTISPECIES: single-stranded-DNA-specific exonuclease RecJ [Anaerostipes]|uniref:single-stranded-DNA-specific exonuclease RecJ n=1 Tax=Anaerostipes TaxID=207244 RepID=UPI001C1E3584|nr:MULTISPECIES: single-stranded-DNA-specific exonuclease RecJ [Anaerostipes]MCI5622945.1 single-stranded-DNA-specific exonuclease RecJ [Anaerostipes sp.]MDY2725741.1 single-stranded-DNA-specific exonuclease RecJ [Anaerostipes faecalis]
MEQWFIYKKKADFQKIAKQFHIDPVIARLIRNREIIQEDEIRKYLYGNLSEISDPFLMKGIREGIEILKQKIHEKKKIRIISDYDVDGIVSNYILLKGIDNLGGRIDFTIPNRVTDGYGINEHLIEKALKDQVDTIITCDNGIAAKEAVSFGKSNGLTMIITDHHEVPFEILKDGSRREILPPADVVIDPKQKECSYPYPYLCGAGVAFQFMRALYHEMGKDQKELEPLLAFLAIATVCDVVDLTGENRIFVKEGLKRISETQNTGLRALLKVHEMEHKDLKSYDLGFVIGPCMNASGRLDTAERVMYLFLENDMETALVTAQELKDLNEQRKRLTEEGVEQSLEQAEKYLESGDKVLVIYLPQCHESIAGIIAGRVKDRVHHPVFVLTDAEEGIKGSGRSIEQYSMFEEMMKIGDVFTKFGGHPMAAGCSMEKEMINIFRDKINENCSLKEEDFIKKVHIDIDMPVDYLNLDLIQQLSILEPFGKENKKPLFAHRKLRIEKVMVFGKGKNVIKLSLKGSQGTRIDGMIFEEEDSFREKMGDKRLITCTYYPVINEYQGYISLQINIQNYFFTEE